VLFSLEDEFTRRKPHAVIVPSSPPPIQEANEDNIETVGGQERSQMPDILPNILYVSHHALDLIKAHDIKSLMSEEAFAYYFHPRMNVIQREQKASSMEPMGTAK
jgi:hypothetical protein